MGVAYGRISALWAAQLFIGCSIYTEDLLVGQAEQEEAAAGGTSTSTPAGSGGQGSSTGGAAPGSGGIVQGTGGTSPSGTGAMSGLGGQPPIEQPVDDPCLARTAEYSLADFEEGTTTLSGGRTGSWFLFNDGTGTQTPNKPASGPMLAEAAGACSTAFGFRTSGTDFTSWGAGIGVDLLPKVSDTKQPDDLSAYSGFAFFARAAETLVLRVSWSDVNTTEEGGVCNPNAGSGDTDRCGDYFGKDVVATVEWTRFVVSFDELRQRGFGLPVAAGFDAAAAYSFRAQTGAASSFEFWIDELTLVPAN